RGMYVGKWVSRKQLFNAYDTEQVFKDDVMYVKDKEEPIDMRAPFTYLTPWHLKGRYLEKAKKGLSLQNLVALIPLTIAYQICKYVPPVRPYFGYREPVLTVASA
uniref:hypothetical protein n=1 Tax=Amphritea japonica TaxID=452627 RepID=UPI0004775045